MPTKWRNLFREFIDWCGTEHKLDVDDIREQFKQQLDKMVTAGVITASKARGRFKSHSTISLWGGHRGTHRRIGPDNYFIFNHPLVAKFNSGRAKKDQLNIENYVNNTPPSTQHVNRRASRPAHPPKKRVAHRRL